MIKKQNFETKHQDSYTDIQFKMTLHFLLTAKTKLWF